MEIGYHHGKTYFTGLRKAGGNRTTSNYAQEAKPPWLPGGIEHHQQWDKHRHMAKKDTGTYTFTDLAEMVCQNIRDTASMQDFPSTSSGILSRAESGTGFRSRTGSNSSRRSKNPSGGNLRSSYVQQPQHPGPLMLHEEDSDDTGIML